MDTNFFILSFLENLIDLHTTWTKYDEMINHGHISSYEQFDYIAWKFDEMINHGHISSYEQFDYRFD